MATTIVQAAHAQMKNLFASTGAEDLAVECLRVTLGAASGTIYCNHKTKGSINTKAVRQALLCLASASNSTAYAENVAQPGPVISTTTFVNDTITLNGVTSGQYDVLIIGRTN
jgi:hypothetical protein